MLQPAHNQANDSLEIICNLYTLCECNDWPNHRTANKEIENAFNISNYVEKLALEAAINNVCNEFNLKYKTYLNSKNIHSNYINLNLATASDYVLCKFLTASNLKVEMVDFAIGLYMQKCGAERFEQLLTDSILAAASYKTLNDIILSVSKDEENIDLEVDYILSFWNHQCNIGKHYLVEETVCSMFQDINTKDLKLMLHLLKRSAGNISNVLKPFLEKILNFFLAEISGNRSVWNMMIKHVEDIIELCCIYPIILVEICLFLISCDSNLSSNEMMKIYGFSLDQYEEFLSIFLSNKTCSNKFNELLQR